ncbi:hypothetical protein V8F06_013992, partial [Rhypophila decipiens]
AFSDPGDISIVQQVSLDLTRPTAFTVLRRAPQAKTVKEQILEAQALTDLPLDSKLYPIITDAQKRRFHLRSHFREKAGPYWINNHGTLLLPAKDDPTTNEEKFWACHKCYSIFDADATTSPARHLVTHGIKKDMDPAQVETNKRPTDSLHPIFSAAPPNKKLKLLTPITTQQRFRRLLVNWVADSDLPFRVVEHQYFRDLLSILNADQTDYLLPKSHNTLRAWMRSEYETHLNTIKSALLATPYPVHLSFDGWSSPGTAAYFAVVAHFFDEERVLNTKLLALPRIRGTHNGENLTKGVIEVVEHFEIGSKLAFFQADNAENNDTCVTTLLAHPNPHLSPAQIQYLQSIKRVRYLGHILNLVARAFLDGKNKE